VRIMKYLLLILSAVFVVSAQSLDSLMTSGAQQVRELKMMPSLISPDELFNQENTSGIVLHPLKVPAKNLIHTGSSVELEKRVRDIEIDITKSSVELEKRVRDLEINITKVSVILENMQKVNEKHTDKFDTIMHFLEVIITAMAGIATALVGVYIKGRKKGDAT
jgi:hypothetical protein